VLVRAALSSVSLTIRKRLIASPALSLRRAQLCAQEGQSTMDDITSESQTIAVGHLRAFIERIERLEEEKKTIGGDIKEVYAELKGSGFDSKTVRTIIRLRKKEDHERQEEEAILRLYMDALGMS
jgi:uncharacterized protein (UPF0335 family)